jgi:hypothetical protein
VIGLGEAIEIEREKFKGESYSFRTTFRRFAMTEHPGTPFSELRIFKRNWRLPHLTNRVLTIVDRIILVILLIMANFVQMIHD